MSKLDAMAVLKALENDLIRDEFRPSGLLIPEVQAPNSDRRADAIWMVARTAHMVGYEIKVTRSDLLSELRDPTKCEPWLKYCDRWWLAVGDASIVDGLMDRIPEDWGVCTPPTNPNRRMMTVLKEAPVLTPADKGPVLGKLISHQAYKSIELQRRVTNAESSYDRMVQQRDERDAAQVEYLRRQANPLEQKFTEVGEAYEKLRRSDRRPNRGFGDHLRAIDAEVIARAIYDAHDMDQIRTAFRSEASSRLRNMEDCIAELGKSHSWRTLKQLMEGIKDEHTDIRSTRGSYPR
ncbi:hypothetical protein [Paeniglutamicibacter terrestris]|uniref:MmcB family DNA repair protein n=1 Tax=Paeniglutamicibacter terrestris TaxID=2723403 RepID=A0ABX1G4A6_9MICC|nr:hypothetical protein [Paeniglutamicibacter terrestris]NKG21078.1 hypothetical protein [Paeniglutamicibacter terrestris]